MIQAVLAEKIERKVYTLHRDKIISDKDWLLILYPLYKLRHVIIIFFIDFGIGYAWRPATVTIRVGDTVKVNA